MKHGSYSTYTNKGCRCDACKEAAREYARDLKRRKEQDGQVRSLRPVAVHGTYSMYTHAGCRCDLCSQARRDYLKDYSPDLPHGTRSMYTLGGCRCDLCSQASRDYLKDYSPDLSHGTWSAYALMKCRCEECTKAAQDYQRQHLYGLDPAEYERMFTEQRGLCAICGETPSNVRGFHVDHDHDTGHVRGLLCHGCNVALGHLREDVARMRSMIEYVQRSKTSSGKGHE